MCWVPFFRWWRGWFRCLVAVDYSLGAVFTIGGVAYGVVGAGSAWLDTGEYNLWRGLGGGVRRVVFPWARSSVLAWVRGHNEVSWGDVRVVGCERVGVEAYGCLVVGGLARVVVGDVPKVVQFLVDGLLYEGRYHVSSPLSCSRARRLEEEARPVLVAESLVTLGSWMVGYSRLSAGPSGGPLGSWWFCPWLIRDLAYSTSASVVSGGSDWMTISAQRSASLSIACHAWSEISSLNRAC